MRLLRAILIVLFCLSTRPLPQALVTNVVAQNQNPSITERAYQDREILYELQSPESHAFRITHDYTVRKVGEKYYFNVVRAGSHVTNPDSVDLDTGEKLKWEIISGKQATERKLPVGDLTTLSSPATIQTLPDGRVSIYVVNPRPDDIRVYFRARRRAGQ